MVIDILVFLGMGVAIYGICWMADRKGYKNTKRW